jgi:hypothetical protein
MDQNVSNDGILQTQQRNVELYKTGQFTDNLNNYWLLRRTVLFLCSSGVAGAVAVANIKR